MKGIKILLLLLLLNKTASWAQYTLKPIVIKRDSVELRCFYPKQYADIVGRISNEIYCDSTESINRQTIHELYMALSTQKQQVAIQRNIIEANQGQILGLNILSSTLKLDLAKSQKYAKNQKSWKYVFIGLSAILGTIAIVK